MKKSTTIQSVGEILTRFNPLEDKYISREFQAYGCFLAEELNDSKRTALYIKFAKTLPRSFLEKALSFVKDAKAKKKGALFMWKLKELGAWEKVGGESKAKKKKIADIPF